jgi:hypothetical protein
VFAYDANGDAWVAGTASLNTTRAQHAVAASDKKIYVFGGIADCANGGSALGGLEEYNPTTNTWSPTTATGTPPLRYGTPLLWTGSELFFYGGANNTIAFSASGARFNPATATWSDISCNLASCERSNGSLFVQAGVVYRWGTNGGNSPLGLKYELATGIWSPWTLPAGTTNQVRSQGLYADDGRRIYYVHAAAAGCPATVEVAIFDKTTMQWLPTDTAAGPANNMGGDAVTAWSGSELFAWSGPGACGNTAMANAGGRYQPAAP